MLKPHLVEEGVESSGKVAIGTTQGDLHDIGKNLVAMMLEGSGYEIVDLGVDVPADKFIEAIRAGANVVAMSALAHHHHDQHAGRHRGHQGGRAEGPGAHHRRRGAHHQVLRGRDRGRRLRRGRLERGAPRERSACRLSVNRDFKLCPDTDMVLRALGADPEVVRERRSPALSVAEQAVAEGRPLLSPVVVSESFEVEEFRHERLRLANGHLSGPLVAEHLHAARYVVLAVCCIGPGVEEAASRCFAEDPALAFGLDAFGSAAVDLLGQAVCQLVDERASADKERTSVPLSPGLVGWPVADGQRQIFALLDAVTGRCQPDRGVHDGAQEVDLDGDRRRGGRGALRRDLRLLLHGRDLPLPRRAHLPPWLRRIPRRSSAWNCNRWVVAFRWRRG